ncbi:hypothetical protein HJFPF1_10900 [Paramyrothecium foliicola]|nr:hypothetical protein HJFPF1_10900 [Paramyrothecium foliicola]
MAQIGLGTVASKFFMLYAHDNDNYPDRKAYADVVRKFIVWFKKLGVDVDSDRSPHGWSPGRSAEILGASNDILRNQLCLLPSEWDSRNVNWVILFESQLLQKYIEDEGNWRHDSGKTYSETLVEKCWKLDSTRNRGDDTWEQTAYEDIAKIQREFSVRMGTTFHHVLTELALVQFRNQYSRATQVIPVLLSGNASLEHPLLQRIFAGVTLLREQVNRQDLYKGFFKIILRFETVERDRFLIEAMRDCFLECKVLVEKKTADGWKQVLVTCESIILKTLQGLVQSPRYQKIERQITLPKIRKILKLHYLMDLSLIQRISGDALPGGCRNIDLVVMDRNAATSDMKPLKPIKIHNLLDDITLQDKGRIMPKRIMIQGLPGIGKSTISRPIAFEFSCHRSLLNKHDLVVHLPLRRLEHTRDIQQLLFEEVFSLERKGSELAAKLAGAILHPAGKHKVLFILDGLDETIGWVKEKYGLLSELVNHPLWRLLGSAWRVFWAYLDNRAIASAEDAADIRLYIEKNHHAKEMIQVPIHLDMLCYSWDELRRRKGINASGTQEMETPTITEIYRAIIHKLWRKDLAKFQKWDQGELLTASVIDKIRIPRRLKRAVEAETKLLGRLAIILHEEGRVEISEKDIDAAIDELDTRSSPLPLTLESHLKKLSFLQQESNINSQKTYKFIHLTFQEYFDALYLMQNPSVFKQTMLTHKYDRRFEIVWRFMAGLLPSEHVEIDCFFSILKEEPRDIVGIRHTYLLMHCLNECCGTMNEALRRNIEMKIWQGAMFETRQDAFLLRRDQNRALNDSSFPSQAFERNVIAEITRAEYPINFRLPLCTAGFRQSDSFCLQILKYVEEGRSGPAQAFELLNIRSLSANCIQLFISYLHAHEQNAATELIKEVLEQRALGHNELPPSAVDELARILLMPRYTKKPWTWRQDIASRALQGVRLPPEIAKRVCRAFEEIFDCQGLLKESNANYSLHEHIYEKLWDVLWSQSSLPTEVFNSLLDLFSRTKDDRIMTIIAQASELDEVIIQRLQNEIRSLQQTQDPIILLRLALHPRLQEAVSGRVKLSGEKSVGMGLRTVLVQLNRHPRVLAPGLLIYLATLLLAEERTETSWSTKVVDCIVRRSDRICHSGSSFETGIGAVLKKATTLNQKTLYSLLSLIKVHNSEDAAKALQGRPEVFEKVMTLLEESSGFERIVGIVLRSEDSSRTAPFQLPPAIVERLHCILRKGGPGRSLHVAAESLLIQPDLSPRIIRDLLHYVETTNSLSMLYNNHRNVHEFCRYA